jgi:NADPH2:quinone reductase
MNTQAIRIRAYGAPEVMRLEDIEFPTPGPGQALVRVEAASVNYLDIQHRRGELVGQHYYDALSGLEFPATIGSQGVGVVEAVGPDVQDVHVGQRVNFYGNSYATHALVPAQYLIPVPDGLTLEQAAGGLSQGFIAYALTHGAFPVKPDDWCLVQAAAGGIGLLACQMAKLRGGRVIGVTSSEEKARYVREAGADEVIVSTQADSAKEARRLTAERGVNVVYDGVGKDTFEASLNSLAPRGYLVIFGQSSGYIPPFDLMALQEKGALFITRTSAVFYRDLYPAYLQDFVRWVRAGQLSIRIDRAYPLADAAKAHAAVEQRQVSGRVLLLP